MASPQIDARTARLLAPLAIAAAVGLNQVAAESQAPGAEATPGASPVVTPLATPGVSPAASPVAAGDDPGIQRRLSALLQGESGVYGVVIARADGRVLGARNSELPFMTASLYKLILMADIYRKIERGSIGQQDLIGLDWSVFGEDGETYFGWDQIGYSFPIQEYLFAAGAFSSNAAAWTLLTLTSYDDLAQTTADIGLSKTYVMASLSQVASWPPSGGVDATSKDAALASAFVESWADADGLISITTPRDMAIYMHALVTKTLLSPWISEQIVTILAQQMVRDRIPALLPVHTQTINKTGNLDSVVNDAGIIELPQGPRIVALLSEAMPDVTRAALILQRLALIATGATTIPPLDVPDPEGLDLIDTTDPTSWDAGDPVPEGSDDSDGTDGPAGDDVPGDDPDSPTPDAASDGS